MTDDIRLVARVLVINDQCQTYLLRGHDITVPNRDHFWFTPGGKIDAGETSSQAAVRELYEEVGLVVTTEELGAIVGTEVSNYHFHGKAYRQEGVFYACFSNEAGLNTAHWSEIETQTIDQGRWWSLTELEATQETVYPSHLAAMLAKAIK
jgi:8-oxo-dGTP pyrophosphatase MutT (NUDIX family)